MQTEYKAKLKDGHVEWMAGAPPSLLNGAEVMVKISPREYEKRMPKGERGRRMRAALDKLARSNAFAGIKDPVAWQKEIRKDRPLPGRES